MRSISIAARRAEKLIERTRPFSPDGYARSAVPRVREFMFVAQSADNLVAIGASTNPIARLEALRRESGTDIDLVFVGMIKGPIADIRRRVLDLLADHDCGEHWFDVAPAYVVGVLHRVAFQLQGSVTQLELNEVADLIAGPSVKARERAAPARAHSIPTLAIATETPARSGPVITRILSILTPTTFKLSALGFLLLFYVIAQLLSVR